ncbi:magnesium chelatase subunit D [Roseisalinus antarcticus]|uniref:Magnesium-chelatase 60 kDa subunit n=1 Tax=Roseisalinus antarcticus TaxID=254357 RepID=A0A1Y5S699_9RHOB|nr:magnesium chelatase subunit D [Roseisalinus antarcticus]SLN31057.1 Magnesium-chelatase 60 kDa subunit [Roseisalinus antarcticus]
MPDFASPLFHAALALDLVAIDPGLGGLVLRARSGFVRDAVVGRLSRLPLPLTRLHPQVSDEALYGGLDLAATLAAGTIVQEQGLLTTPSTLLLSMAERCPPGLAARLAGCMDREAGHMLIALDEGAEPDEACSPTLADRVAFRVDLEGATLAETRAPLDAPDLAEARARLAQTMVTLDLHRQTAELAVAFGVDGLRAPMFAIRAARAHAALRDAPLAAADVEVACAMVLAHRATRIPERDEDTETESPEPPPPDDGDGAEETPDQDSLEIPQELLLEAVSALLPPDLLDQLQARALRGARGSGAGAVQKGNRRGRPLPSRPGRPGNGARVDLVGTLRTAAPWQRMRAETAAVRDGLHIRASDIRLKRYEDRSDRVLIFAVDASGSAALARLAEAKGAIELLLGEAYARRDYVSLIAFRGTASEVLLPPTRSLVQTKRRLAELPGGGGTPLAAGLQTAMAEAEAARRRGMSPTICVLTDGRANIALDGSADRKQAAADAEKIARIARASRIEGLVLDCGNRPERSLATLADVMGARYLALPRANAERLSAAVSAALGD